MIAIPLQHILIFSLLLFAIGLYGALVRRNIIGILISIELMVNASNINLIAFSKYTSLAGNGANLRSFCDRPCRDRGGRGPRDRPGPLPDPQNCSSR